MGTIALIVEELSPTDGVTPVHRRVVRFRKAGVPLIWLVEPQERMVIVHRASKGFQVLEETEELIADEIRPGFRFPAGELLAPPAPQQGGSP